MLVRSGRRRLVAGDTASTGNGAFLGALVAALEIRHLSLSFFLGDAVALLHPSDQLIALPLDHRPIVVGEPAPLLLGLAGELLPVSGDLIPIHVRSPGWVESLATMNARGSSRSSGCIRGPNERARHDAARWRGGQPAEPPTANSLYSSERP